MSTRRTLLTALIATACSIPALAQSDTPPAEPAAAAVSVAGADPVAAPVTRDKDTLSVDFPDEDIKTILRNVADLFELNLVVPDTLTGKTSIKLRDVTWRQIFQVVLSPVGYTYIEEGNIIKIVSNELLQQEPVATDVFILNNAKAVDIKPTIDGLIDAATGGKIMIDARSNALVITERPSRMGRIRSIIEQLDKATDQVMIESKFVEVTDRDIRNIGVNWASLQGMQFGVGGISQSFNRDRGQTFNSGTNVSNGTTSGTTNSSNGSTTNLNGNGTNATTSNNNTTTYVTSPATINNSNGSFATSSINPVTGTVSGLPATVPSVTSVADFSPFIAGTPATAASVSGGVLIPAVPAVASIPATFTAPVTFNGSNTNGSNASTSTNIASGLANTVSNTLSNAVNDLTGLVNTGGTSRVASAVFTASDFNVIISALKTQNNTKIVSNPTVVTLNNTEAILNIGQEFPIPKYNYNSERGTFEVAGFEYKPIGVILKVTPQVNGRGVIKLVLEPEVSQQNGSTSFGGAGGALIPIIATRKVKTQISLQSGSTAGIGGLITNSINHGGTKVPILGDIPLLGRLFTSKAVNDEATNLLIFITAKTISADGALPEEVFDPRAVEAIGMSREDLPGNRPAKGTDMFAPVERKK